MAVPAAAQQAVSPAAQEQVIVTTGEGVVRRPPDRAWVTIANESRAATAREAQRANAEAMSAVNAQLKASGIAADAIQTSGFNLQPEFDYANGKQTLRGYVARNQVQVRVDAIAKLGDILATSVGSGATTIGGIRFDLQDRDAAERDALKSAVADARARAEAAAAGAGVRIERILRVEEHREYGPQPMQAPVMAMRAAPAVPPPVPMETGEIEIRSRVTLTAAIR